MEHYKFKRRTGDRFMRMKVAEIRVEHLLKVGLYCFSVGMRLSWTIRLSWTTAFVLFCTVPFHCNPNLKDSSH